MLAAYLKEANVELTCATNAAAAWHALQTTPVDLVLLDLGLPDLNGFECCAKSRKRRSLQAIPVIVLTAWNGVAEKVRSFELGATDYLTKPFEAAELQARVCTALRTSRLPGELGKTNHEL